jgi:putative DNA primase/helicase
VFLVIDTLNNHMSGDENSARDTRSMINACNVISSATGATVGFVHHVAHSADSKHRARGSSAWRGALDTSVLVAYENDETIKVTCTKMKDAQEPEDIFGEIQAVDLGWVDEDGEPLTGAVFVQKDHTPTQKTKDNPILKHQKMFEKAWFDSGAEVIDGKPYLSRSAFMDYLTTKMDMKESSADQYAKGSTKGKPIYELLLAGVIEKHSHGWLVVDNLLSSAFLLSKNEEKLP